MVVGTSEEQGRFLRSLGIGDIGYDRETGDETILLRTLKGECDKPRDVRMLRECLIGIVSDPSSSVVA